MSNIDFKKIKLVIWDMDETFWSGTISEGDVVTIDENVQLIKELTDRGIICSISSKNDEDTVKNKLIELGIWELFVFNNISWTPKGEKIKNKIDDMHLRPENCLFIDDNVSNLEEAKYMCPDLMVSGPEIISELKKRVALLGKNDVKHSRLNQYKILEQKRSVERKSSSNEEFLYKSNIRVNILKNIDEKIDRALELIMRTNQLNYTKRRLTEEELIEAIAQSDDSALIEARDNFGNYGIVGLYILKDGELTDFLFSCRTMGMGIEQYVYSLLGYPTLDVKGEVAYDVNDYEKAEWINQEDDENSQNEKANNKSIKEKCTILMKGPCDLEQLVSYIQNSENIDREFSYIEPTNGVNIESYNDTFQIVEAYRLSEKRKEEIIDELPFSSDLFFSDRIYSEKYKMVFYSLFSDPNLGLYRRKETGEIIAFGEFSYDLTDSNNWKDYISGKIYTANCVFTEKILQDFSQKYEYIGQPDPEKVFENIKFIREKMCKDAKLVLLLGSELDYKKNTQLAYIGRHQYHQKLNSLIKKWVLDRDDVYLLDFNKYVKSQEDMFNNINHFVKPVYYKMSEDAIELINKVADGNIRRKSALYMKYTYFKQKNPIVNIYYKLRHKVKIIVKNIIRKGKK